MRNTSNLLCTAILSILLSPTASQAEQLLFGTHLDPYRVTRSKSVAEMYRKRYLERIRSSGVRNGLLAEDLQRHFTPISARAMTGETQDDVGEWSQTQAAIDEWLTVYPKTSSNSQRYLAPSALAAANDLRQFVTSGGRHWAWDDPQANTPESIAAKKKLLVIADKITSCVLNAALANNWYLTSYAKEQLQSIVDKKVDSHFTEQIAEILAKKPLQADVEYDRMLSETSVMAKCMMEVAPNETIKYPKLQNSWWPKYVASLRGPDGKLKEKIAVDSFQTTIKAIPAKHAAELSLKIKNLADAYTKLPLESKERVAGDTLQFTERAFKSNVQPSVESLLWRVVNTVDPAWLEHDIIPASLPYLYSYGDVDKAEKLFSKTFEIEEYIASEPPQSASRYNIGDFLDRNGRIAEARVWYEKARQLDDIPVRTGLREKTNDIERIYTIRMGPYKPRKIASKLGRGTAGGVLKPQSVGNTVSKWEIPVNASKPDDAGVVGSASKGDDLPLKIESGKISSSTGNTEQSPACVPSNSSSVGTTVPLLFGTPYTPFSKEQRDKVWADLNRQGFERDRKPFGTKNGMLANDLENEFAGPFYGGEITAHGLEALSEWETVYAKTSSGSQRFLALVALNVANMLRSYLPTTQSEEKKEQLSSVADRLTVSVLNAAAANNWRLSNELREQLKNILKLSDDQHFHSQIDKILQKEPLASDVEYDQLLSDAKAATEAALQTSPNKRVKLSNIQNSWWPKFVASLKGPDGKLIEEVGEVPSEAYVKDIPPEQAEELNLKTSKLERCFAKLPEEGKERVTADTLKFVNLAFTSNVHPAMESLMWRVLNAIDPAWLEQNLIGSSFPSIYLYEDVDKTVKFYRKQIEIQEMHNFENSSIRYQIGDVLDRHGRREEAKQWYEKGRQIDERNVRTGVVEKTESTERDYNIRTGKYKPSPKPAGG